jgi:hypothetical protein
MEGTGRETIGGVFSILDIQKCGYCRRMEEQEMKTYLRHKPHRFRRQDFLMPPLDNGKYNVLW